MVEPVHWAARLVRAPGVLYTEVDGLPCLVRAADGLVRALTPTWAGIWAQLDGRPVAQALNIDPDALDPIDARNLLEVLRRLKGTEMVCDAGPADTRQPTAALDPAMVRAASVRIVLDGSIDRDRSSVGLTIEPGSTGRAVLTLADAAGTVRVTTRRRLRTRTVERVSVIDPTASGADQLAAGAFASIVKAVEDRTVLLTPGLVDLLAGLAERATAPGSPRR
ncbi:MAG TPA: hypothetical protein VFN21_10140 [Acidimicrobiales bacterium]|nr:hypothetical protein [Acidimicrobiales bacterium]